MKTHLALSDLIVIYIVVDSSDLFSHNRVTRRLLKVHTEYVLFAVCVKCQIFVVNAVVVFGMFAPRGVDIHVMSSAAFSALIKENIFTIDMVAAMQETGN